jgi:hypothetical protein
VPAGDLEGGGDDILDDLGDGEGGGRRPDDLRATHEHEPEPLELG